jgi:hypothetical protein
VKFNDPMERVVQGFEIAGVAIVLVRTFLSFSLEIELEGTLPWRRGSTEKRPDPAVSVGDGPG